MKNQLKLAVCQMTSVDNVDENLRQIENLVSSVPVAEKVDLFCFPENCLYMRLVEGEQVQGLNLEGPAFAQLGKLANKYNTHLHLGASPLHLDGHLYNASIFVGPDGHVTSTYQKIHLFDIHLTGQKPMRESDVFKHGSKPGVIELHGWKIGQSICYDLRFSELYSHYTQQDCDLILIPAAFLPKTGEAHWEILVRARAIESQAYVVASAQGGRHQNAKGAFRDTYGHSLIVDPWGKVLTQLQQQPSLEIQVLSKERVAEVRRQIPMKAHRRGTLR